MRRVDQRESAPQPGGVTIALHSHRLSLVPIPPANEDLQTCLIHDILCLLASWMIVRSWEGAGINEPVREELASRNR